MAVTGRGEHRCTECFAEDRNRPATVEVETPMRQHQYLCDQHWEEYLVARLGAGTFAFMERTEAAAQSGSEPEAPVRRGRPRTT